MPPPNAPSLIPYNSNLNGNPASATGSAYPNGNPALGYNTGDMFYRGVAISASGSPGSTACSG